MDIITWLDNRTALDLATAISVIGASILFVYNKRQEYVKQTGEERERLRVEKLIDIRDTIADAMGQWQSVRGDFGQSPSSSKGILLNLYNNLSSQVLPNSILFSREGNGLSASQMLLTQDYYKEFEPNIFLCHMCVIKREIMIQIRILMQNADFNTSCEADGIIDAYLKVKYEIPEDKYRKYVLNFRNVR